MDSKVFKKERIVCIDRFSNFGKSFCEEYSESYIWESGTKVYINPQSSKTLNNCELEDIIEDKILSFIEKENYENKIFFEKFNVYENISFDEVFEKRHWGYIRTGIIANDKGIYNISKPIFAEESLDELLHEFVAMNKVINKPYRISPYNITEETIFHFRPQAAAYIAHEVMGHCFEKDYYEMFTSNLFNVNTDFILGCSYSFKEINKHKRFTFRGIDDRGVVQNEEKVILNNGKIENLITGNRINDKDGTFKERMSCTYLEGEKSADRKEETYIDVYSISSGFVDYMNNKVILLINLAELVEGDEVDRLSLLPIEIPLRNVFRNIVHVGNNVKIYQNFCNKDRQVIDVFSGAPTIIMKGFSLLRG